mgnify:CR=1 FL=1
MNKSGRSVNPFATQKKEGGNMTEKRKEMFERTVENLKKLDKESLAIVKASVEILAARQKLDENTPTNAA